MAPHVPPTPTPLLPAGDPARQTLAERNRLRELRAERLARLHLHEAAPEAGPGTGAATEAAGALEDFLRALTAGLDEDPAPARPPAAQVVPLPRPVLVELPSSDLGRLPGAGPGLLWALRRAGIVRLADLAGLEAADLAARLGPIGRLVPAGAWIEFARTAA